MERRYELMGWNGALSVETYTVDNAPEMEGLLVDCHPSLQVEKAHVREKDCVRFDSAVGKTTVTVKHRGAVAAVVQTLRDLAKACGMVLGFDMEWDVTKQPGSQCKVLLAARAANKY